MQTVIPGIRLQWRLNASILSLTLEKWQPFIWPSPKLLSMWELFCALMQSHGVYDLFPFIDRHYFIVCHPRHVTWHFPIGRGRAVNNFFGATKRSQLANQVLVTKSRHNLGTGKFFIGLRLLFYRIFCALYFWSLIFSVYIECRAYLLYISINAY